MAEGDVELVFCNTAVSLKEFRDAGGEFDLWQWRGDNFVFGEL